MIEFLRRNRVLIASGFFLALAVSLILRTGGGRERSDRLGQIGRASCRERVYVLV